MSILDKKLLAGMRARALAYAGDRREVIKAAGDAQHLAKRAIFALHRGDTTEAGEKLSGAEKGLLELAKRFQKKPLLLAEGSYQAALEEFVEAQVFYQFVTTGKMGGLKKLAVSDEVFVAGICDVPGELYRYAIRAATARDFLTVKKCAEAADEIIGELVEFNLTSYLRNKFDQAKQALHKLEQVVYETSLRQ